MHAAKSGQFTLLTCCYKYENSFQGTHCFAHMKCPIIVSMSLQFSHCNLPLCRLCIQLGTQCITAQAWHLKLHYGANIRFEALGETAGLEAGQPVECITGQPMECRTGQPLQEAKSQALCHSVYVAVSIIFSLFSL